jgi:hypothetical protein
VGFRAQACVLELQRFSRYSCGFFMSHAMACRTGSKKESKSEQKIIEKCALRWFVTLMKLFSKEVAHPCHGKLSTFHDYAYLTVAELLLLLRLLLCSC